LPAVTRQKRIHSIEGYARGSENAQNANDRIFRYGVKTALPFAWNIDVNESALKDPKKADNSTDGRDDFDLQHYQDLRRTE
jgi:hypothetical protein